MADSEAKKILDGLWADSGDRTDPDDTTVTPVLVRTTGWPAEYSATDGETPKRRRMNQRFREVDGAASDSMRWGGTLPYDDEIDYLQWAHSTIDADEYVCNVANGPASTVVSPTDAGQTTWDRVAGEINLPARPSTPAAVVSNGQIIWTWNCPSGWWLGDRPL